MESDSEEEFSTLVGLISCRSKKKRNRRMWVLPIVKERTEESLFHTLFNDAIKTDDEKFLNFVRMPKDSFYERLTLIKNQIAKHDTAMRRSIPPAEKLVITLR
ncbi:unnamed protein product [Phaedon cochleariae]|uniref:Uncharacterized protein n=1 Tax=Phaedon cochleariae TaxID=80249 RepID=A0A9N9X0E9_PHACE|nr:unnamed protein product [Phaedon cochleariae]